MVSPSALGADSLSWPSVLGADSADSTSLLASLAFFTICAKRGVTHTKKASGTGVWGRKCQGKTLFFMGQTYGQVGQKRRRRFPPVAG